MLPIIISVIGMTFSFVLSGLYYVLESWEICINFYLVVRVVRVVRFVSCLFCFGFLPSFSSAVPLRCSSALATERAELFY